MSSSNPGLLFYALAFEAIGFFGCQVHMYLRPLGENVSEFFIKLYKRVPSFSRFSNVLVAPSLIKQLHPLLSLDEHTSELQSLMRIWSAVFRCNQQTSINTM